MQRITRFLAVFLLVAVSSIQTASACEGFDTGCIPRDTGDHFAHTGDTGDEMLLYSGGKTRSLVALGAGCATSPLTAPLMASTLMSLVVLLPLLGRRRRQTP